MTTISIPGDIARRLVTASDNYAQPVPVGDYIRVHSERLDVAGGRWRLVIRHTGSGDHYAATYTHIHAEWLRHGRHNYPWPDAGEVEFRSVTPVTETVEVIEYQDDPGL